MGKIVELTVHVYTGSEGKDRDTALDLKLFKADGATLLASYFHDHAPDYVWNEHAEYWIPLNILATIDEAAATNAIFQVIIGPVGHDRVIADYEIRYRWDGSAVVGASQVVSIDLGLSALQPIPLLANRTVSLPPV